MLAEKLNKAISKWENNQGYPETEKLLIFIYVAGIINIYDSLLRSEECMESTYWKMIKRIKK